MDILKKKSMFPEESDPVCYIFRYTLWKIRNFIKQIQINPALPQTFFICLIFFNLKTKNRTKATRCSRRNTKLKLLFLGFTCKSVTFLAIANARKFLCTGTVLLFICSIRWKYATFNSKRVFVWIITIFAPFDAD